MSDKGPMPYNGKFYANESKQDLQKWNEEYTLSPENIRNGIIGVATTLAVIFGSVPAYHTISKLFFKNEPQKVTRLAKDKYELNDTRGKDKTIPFLLFENAQDSLKAAQTGEVIGTFVKYSNTKEAVLKLYQADDQKQYKKLDQLNITQ